MNLFKVILLGFLVFFFMWICLFFSMWIVGVCIIVRLFGLVILCIVVMLGGGFRGWFFIVGGFFGDIGIFCLFWRVGECFVGGVFFRDVMWGCWGGGGWVIWSRVWVWEWGICWWFFFFRFEFVFGVCWVIYNGICIYLVKGLVVEGLRVYMIFYMFLFGMNECVYLYRYNILVFFIWC